MGPIQFTAQLYSVRTTKDGGGRLTFEFGADAISAIQEIMTLNSRGEVNFAIACVEYGEKLVTNDLPDLST